MNRFYLVVEFYRGGSASNSYSAPSFLKHLSSKILTYSTFFLRANKLPIKEFKTIHLKLEATPDHY